MSLRTNYDAWHQRIYDAAPDHEDESSPWYRLVREYLGGLTGLRVLDAACGRGGFVRELARERASVTGCDFSSVALHAAATKVFRSNGHPPLATLLQGDAQSLPYADAFRRRGFLRNHRASAAGLRRHPRIARVTRPGGKLLLTTPNYANFMDLYELYARFRNPGRKDDRPFDRRQWVLKILKWIRHAGWTMLRSDGTLHQFQFFPSRNPVRWEALEANGTLRKLLSPLAYAYFIAAEKTEAAR